ncbi:alanine racemase [Kiritimatiellaeota bacterium B1221]|nr:alanine racemase [Kiritimatiellaeota bacterium B1221]
MQSPSLSIDLDTLAGNIRALHAKLRPDSQIMFVVKSEAYGHGIHAVAERAAQEGIRWFAVAYFEEALEVRKAAPDADILVLGPISPEETPLAIQYRITPTVVDAEHAKALATIALQKEKTLNAHIKIDTGMGRMGTLESEDDSQIKAILNTPGLEITGICSHLATVDLKRPWLQEKQHQRFVNAFTVAEAIAGRRLMRHFCSSRGIQYYPEWDYDAVRPGILLYGYGCNDPRMRVQTKPLLQMKSRLMQVKRVPEGTPVGYYSSYRTTRETQIAVVGAGYADGYLRSLSNRGEALVHGERVPVVGRISMNWITLDLGPDLVCKAGDDVVLIGEQNGNEVWADWLGRRAGTIAYEILTAIHPRIPRQYR